MEILITFILLIWIYHEMFKLKWHKAVLAWLVQLAFIVVFRFLFALIATVLGIALESIWF